PHNIPRYPPLSVPSVRKLFHQYHH
ncbi:unnamed protein product, partial [Rotaria sordida]